MNYIQFVMSDRTEYPEETPVYREIDEMLLIGIDNREDAVDFPEKLDVFTERVLSREYLIVEADRRVADLALSRDSTDFMSTALRKFKATHGLQAEERIKYLGDGADYVELGRRNGLRPYLLALYSAFSDMAHGLSEGIETQDIPELVRQSAISKAGQLVGWNAIDPNRVVDMFNTAIMELDDSHIAADIGDAAEEFIDKWALYEVLGNNLLKFDRILEGTKVAVVSAQYFRDLEKQLTDQYGMPPETWRRFIENLDHEVKNGILKIEQELFPDRGW